MEAIIGYDKKTMSNSSVRNGWLRKFLIYHLPAILYAGLIIAVSSISNLKTPKIVNLQFDKIAHFIEYALLAFLVFRSAINLGSKITRNRAFIIASVFVLIFAQFDELYQKMVPGRDASIGDLAVDLLGAALVLILLWYRGKSPKTEAKEAEQ